MKEFMRKKEFIILSATLTRSIESNRTRTDRLENILLDLELPYKKVGGVYQGLKEVSFMVIVKDEDELQTVKDLGLKSFEQESVLYRDYKGNARLLFSDGTSKELGRFVKGKGSDMVIVDGVSFVCEK